MFNLRTFWALFRPELYTPYELALRALAQRRYDEALRLFDAVLADATLSPAERAAALSKRGVTLVHLGQPDGARDAFNAALAAAPRFAPALANLGNLALEAGKLEEAVELYRRAVSADSDYAPAHHNLGVAYKRLGRTAEAVRELRMAQRLDGRKTPHKAL